MKKLVLISILLSGCLKNNSLTTLEKSGSDISDFFNFLTTCEPRKREKVKISLKEKASKAVEENNFPRKNEIFIKAIKFNNCEIANYMLENGAHINYEDDYGKSAIFYAIDNDRLDLAKFLLTKGADINLRSDINVLQSYLLRFYIRGEKIVQTAALKETVQFIVDNKVDVNTLSYGDDIPLFLAIKHQSYDIVEILLKAGAPLSISSDRNGKTGLSKIIKRYKSSDDNDNKKLIEILINNFPLNLIENKIKIKDSEFFMTLKFKVICSLLRMDDKELEILKELKVFLIKECLLINEFENEDFDVSKFKNSLHLIIDGILSDLNSNKISTNIMTIKENNL